MPPADPEDGRELSPSPSLAVARMGRTPRFGAARLAPWIAAALVLIVGLALIWPLPLGVMPMSADHTVHLTRAWLYGQVIAGGELRGWSTMWFFGAPVGELYPPLGDLLVALLRVVSFGQASWATAYAWMVTLVFVLQGWALVHAGVTIGRGRPASTSAGPAAGLVAGASIGAIAGVLALLDAGTYREGGWIYTVLYGVWPQALATSLAVLCLSEAVRARQTSTPGKTQRHLLKAGLAGGLALLAHPMSLPSLALAASLGLFLLPRARGLPERSSDGEEKKEQKEKDRRLSVWSGKIAEAAGDLALVSGIALALAAWWLLPMLAHRGWMASYGWLHVPLATMTAMAKGGQWTANMPASVGYAIWAGLALVALRGPALARLLGAWALCQWLLASSDVFSELRLDLLSEGFAHVQYQRFLIAAKPGLFLLAGVGVVGIAGAIARVWRSRFRARLRVPTAAVLAGGLALLSVGMINGSRAAIAKYGVGEVPTERFFHLATRLKAGAGADETQSAAELDRLEERVAAYDELLVWLAQRWRERGDGETYRIAFQAGRNEHWFMDSPLVSRTPTYKIGFTPGDNFVHKPEAASERLLDRLGVRYLIRERGNARGTVVQRFGPFTVFERTSFIDAAPTDHIAHIDGPGEVEVIDNALDDGHLRLRIRGADPQTSRLVIHVGGYPRWELRQDGILLPWVETPAIHFNSESSSPARDNATPEERRRGLLRGGKANGDDGSEPTLIAAPVADGEVTLDYARWRAQDIAAALLSLLGALATIILWRRAGTLCAGRRSFVDRLRALSRQTLRPSILLAATMLLFVGLGLRWQRAHSAEASLASAWLSEGRAYQDQDQDQDHSPQAFTAGPLKADMLLRPAILLAPHHRDPATLIFPGVRLGEGLHGFVALDDDAAKRRRRGQHRIRVDARQASSGDAAAVDGWIPQLNLTKVPHRPGRLNFEIAGRGLDTGAPVDLRVTIVSDGASPPPVGFNIELGAAHADPELERLR